MSAARVLNPVVLSEFCKIGASPAKNRNFPCGRQLDRIKRDLFGPVNPAEIKKLFTEQLEQHQEKAMKRWGFDFRAGTPLNTNPQFSWERVSFQESTYAPEMYTLTRAAHVRPAIPEPSALEILMDERAERANNSSLTDDTDSCDDSHDDSATELTSTTSGIFKVPATRSRAGAASSNSNSSPSVRQLRKRQPKITEYMKERKRLAQIPKKVSPLKRMRSNSGSNSGAGVSHSTHANSISAHFSLRNLPPRNN